MEFSPEIGATLGALSNVPGLGAIAAGASLAYSLLSDEPEPRLMIPRPFQPGGLLWGVPRRMSGPRKEISAIVTYRGAHFNQLNWVAGQVGAVRVGLHPTERPPAGISSPARATGMREATTQAIPYTLGKPIAGARSSALTIEDALWSELLRRRHPEAMVGTWLYLHGRPTRSFSTRPRLTTEGIEILDVRVLDGWWDTWTDDEGGKINQDLTDELAAARARRLSTSAPEWTDLDTRTWAAAYTDEWQTFAAQEGETKAGALASWRSPRAGSAAAAAREAFEAERVEILAAYTERRAAWEAWRFALESETERALAFDAARAQYDEAWELAVSQGKSFDQAAQFAVEVLARPEAPPTWATSPSSSLVADLPPASSPASKGTAVVAIAAAALLALLVLR